MALPIEARERFVGRPAETVLVVYLLIAAATCLLLRPENGVVLFAAHMLLAIGLFALSRVSDPRVRILRAGRTLLPFLLYGPLYVSTGMINRALPVWIFDGPLERFEGLLFGGQPSLFLAERFDSLPLSEFLHACYFGFYFLIPLVPITLLLKRKTDVAAEVVGSLTHAFVLCLVFYLWLPATSPLYQQEMLGAPQSQGLFFGLTHRAAEVGGVVGGAFPSSHAAISFLALLLAWRYTRGLFWIILLPTLGLLVGTVYGRYHFTVDTLAGIALALVIAAVWPRMRRSWLRL